MTRILKENPANQPTREHGDLHLVVQAVQDHAIIQTDASGFIQSWNAGAEKILGWRSEEVLGKDSSLIFVPEDVERLIVENEMKTARETGKAEDNRWHLRRDGSRFFAMGVMNPLKDASGNLLGYVKVLRDQTRRKEFEDELKEREEELRSFIMQVPTPMVIVLGSEFRFSVANPAYERLVGRKVVGKTVLEAFTEKEVGHFIPLLDEVYRTGKPYIGKEMPLSIPDEKGVIRKHFVNIDYHPFIDRMSEVKGVFAVVHDVTEEVQARKEAETSKAQLAAEKLKLESIFQASPAAMAVWRGPNLVFELVNPAYQEIFPDRELKGKEFLEALPEFVGQPFPELITKVLETGVPFTGREVLARHPKYKNGPMEDHYYDFTYVRLNDPDGNPYGVYDHAVDVTDRVVAQRQIAESLKGLEQEREIRERFVATLSHDLRTPLTAAKLSAQILGRKAEDPNAVRNLAAKIADNIDRTDRMIRDLLDANRIKAGEALPVNIDLCNLTQLAQETLEELGTLYGDRFSLEMPEEAIEGFWSCDGLQRILENLCHNAIKYGASDRPVRVSLLRESSSVVIAVTNWGAPIPVDDQKQLFEPYRRTASAQAGREKGWGLGLTLVKGITEALGGTVAVESSLESGTTFKVTLPGDSRGVGAERR